MAQMDPRCHLLISAAVRDDMHTAFRLVTQGVDVSFANDAALLVACWHRSVNVAVILLQWGANVNVGNCQPLDIAIRKQHAVMVELLLMRGARRHDALYQAQRTGNLVIMDLIRRYGAYDEPAAAASRRINSKNSRVSSCGL